ncbi:MAG: 3,4-dihydroxy-2-butanone-4-phosphate synthase [uncultured bacterium]|nr:MAG: 3,4-dihydroxy-2-butanone-4-phosphate synthase [uncultured bacterium]
MNKEKKGLTLLTSANLPTVFGEFTISIYKSSSPKSVISVLTIGDYKKSPTLVRVHSKCFTGDTLSSLRCDCQAQLHKSLKMIAKKGNGVLVYLDQEGRGIGLTNKIKAYALQDKKMDTVQANLALGLKADQRKYAEAAGILKILGLSEIHLLTNNPDKIQQLEKNGIKISKRIPLEIKPNKFDAFYLSTKKNKMHHILHQV